MKPDLARSLRGIRVIDASRVLAGPFAAQTLADLGADVIKIEQPGTGDDTRTWGPPFVGSPEMSAYFLSANRGKRSLALDLRHPKGAPLLQRLLGKSDVLIENFRSDSLAGLGLDPESLLAENPHLVICSISGFGRTGMHANRPGYDFVMQGMSGMMAKTGSVEGPPAKVGVAITDIVTGLYACIAILASLQQRDTTGHGYHIDLSLLDCAVASMSNVAQAYLATGVEPRRQGNAHLQIVPYEAFATRDGWIILAVGNDLQWRRFADSVGQPSLASDPRFATNTHRLAHREVLIALITQLMCLKSTHEWLTILETAQVPAGPVWTLSDLFSSELARERELKVTIKDPAGQEVNFLKSPLSTETHKALFPPRIGEHSAEILHEVLGLEEAEIHALAQTGVFK